MADTRRIIGEGLASFSTGVAEQLMQGAQQSRLADLMRTGDAAAAVQQGIPIETAMQIVKLQAAQQEQQNQERLRREYFSELGDDQPSGKTNAAKVNDKYEVKQSTSGKFRVAKKKDSKTIASAHDLLPEQQLQAAQTAKKIGGVRGMNALLPSIYEMQRQGKTIDQIEDDLRFSGQSELFTGVLRDAAQQITSKMSDKQTQLVFDKFDDVIQSGKPEKTKAFLQKMVRDSLPTEQSKTLMGQERTLEFIGEIRSDLAEYEASGGDTNIFSGTLEEANAKILGRVNDPELRKIATKIMKARQQYRRAMTGVAFSPGENAEYDAIFPSISKTGEFNTATLEALSESFKGDVDFIYSRTMGEDAYGELFGGGVGQEAQPAASAQDKQALAAGYTQEEIDAYKQSGRI